MNRRGRELRVRFWFELALSGLTGLLFVVTLFWHDWLEAFGLDPDHHNGTAEWLIVVGLFVLCSFFSTVARLEYRRVNFAG